VHADRPGWPPHLRPGAVRFARTSGHFDDTTAFYRDVVGLPVVGEFTGSFGEDGIILGFPDTRVQLEIVRRDAPTVGTFDQLVLYLDDATAVTRATSRLHVAGVEAVEDPHAYWAANGAVIFRDPDGREVVFAPWVYGRDPEPIEATTDPGASVTIIWFDGDRHALRPLFAEAEDSPEQIDTYINEGRVLVASSESQIVGHLQLVNTANGDVEIKNMAVAPERRGTGIGRALVKAALRATGGPGAKRMIVATAAADIGNLRFYQRCGFRFAALERDAFTANTGYPDPIAIDGIMLRDRVWLDQPLTRP
jgi:GNAT superfamily N-acetyltransferase